MKKAKILIFSVLKDKIGSNCAELDLPEMLNAGDLINLLVDQYPDIKPMKELLKVSVDRKYVQSDITFSSNSEIAVFPPVSGG